MRTQTKRKWRLQLDAVLLRHGFGTMAFASLWLVVTTGLAAEDKSVSRTHIEDLIRQLDANTLAERSRAERDLIDLGPPVLPLLPPPELIESVSAREAIRRIRPRLERRAARESAAASEVSLQGEYALSEVLKQIEHQTRNEISLAEEAAHQMSGVRQVVQWDKTSFWQCLDDLCQRTSLRWQFIRGEPVIRLFPQDSEHSQSKVVDHAGPFRIAVDRVQTRSVVGNESLRILRIDARLAVEPRLRPLFVSMAATELKAVADNTAELAPWNPDARYEFPVGDGGRELPVQWDFRWPAGTNAKAISLVGQLHCQIAAATERVVFDQKSLARGTIRRRGGVTIRLRDVTFEPAEDGKINADIGIAVSYDIGGPAFESHRSWIFHNAVYLETKDGARIPFTDFETTQQADGAVAVEYRWKNVAGPSDQYRFVYEAPTLIIDVPVKVNIPMISQIE